MQLPGTILIPPHPISSCNAYALLLGSIARERYCPTSPHPCCNEAPAQYNFSRRNCCRRLLSCETHQPLTLSCKVRQCFLVQLPRNIVVALPHPALPHYPIIQRLKLLMGAIAKNVFFLPPHLTPSNSTQSCQSGTVRRWQC